MIILLIFLLLLFIDIAVVRIFGWIIASALAILNGIVFALAAIIGILMSLIF